MFYPLRRLPGESDAAYLARVADLGATAAPGAYRISEPLRIPAGKALRGYAAA